MLCGFSCSGSGGYHGSGDVNGCLTIVMATIGVEREALAEIERTVVLVLVADKQQQQKYF